MMNGMIFLIGSVIMADFVCALGLIAYGAPKNDAYADIGGLLLINAALILILFIWIAVVNSRTEKKIIK